MIPKSVLAVVSVFYFWLRAAHQYNVKQNQEYSYTTPFRYQPNTFVNIQVIELLHTVDYGRWWIPRLRRVIYKATFQKIVDEVVVDTQEEWYPMLNYAGLFDPMYPLLVVGLTHTVKHLTVESDDELDS